jgi:hypothetical protein
MSMASCLALLLVILHVACSHDMLLNKGCGGRGGAGERFMRSRQHAGCITAVHGSSHAPGIFQAAFVAIISTGQSA